MRVVFFGSGPFALPALDTLCSQRPAAGVVPVDVARVVTRPPRPKGRGRKLAPTPVGAACLSWGRSCDTPETANDPDYLAELASLQADLFIVADYGEMLCGGLRRLPGVGAFNLHASLLPRYRGAAPVARALLQGETVTGVTLFRVERRLDSGPIVDSVEVAVEPLETAGELEHRLSHAAARLLERNLRSFRDGTFRETPQDEQRASLAPKLQKAEGCVSWDTDPRKLTDFVRALNPWPTAWSHLQATGRARERTSFLRVCPSPRGTGAGRAPGSIEEVRKDGFRITCRDGSVEVLELRREGGPTLRAPDYLRGRPLQPGDSFGPA